MTKIVKMRGEGLETVGSEDQRKREVTNVTSILYLA